MLKEVAGWVVLVVAVATFWTGILNAPASQARLRPIQRINAFIFGAVGVVIGVGLISTAHTEAAGGVVALVSALTVLVRVVDVMTAASRKMRGRLGASGDGRNTAAEAVTSVPASDTTETPTQIQASVPAGGPDAPKTVSTPRFDVVVRYRDAAGIETDRTVTVQAFHIADAEGGTTIQAFDGWCHMRRAERTFRLDRIRQLADPTTGKPVANPAAWLLAKAGSEQPGAATAPGAVTRPPSVVSAPPQPNQAETGVPGVPAPYGWPGVTLASGLRIPVEIEHWITDSKTETVRMTIQNLFTNAADERHYYRFCQINGWCHATERTLSLPAERIKTIADLTTGEIAENPAEWLKTACGVAVPLAPYRRVTVEPIPPPVRFEWLRGPHELEIYDLVISLIETVDDVPVSITGHGRRLPGGRRRAASGNYRFDLCTLPDDLAKPVSIRWRDGETPETKDVVGWVRRLIHGGPAVEDHDEGTTTIDQAPARAHAAASDEPRDTASGKKSLGPTA